MINKKRVVVSVLCLLLLVFGVFSFSACKGDDHTHTYESAWSYDAENHWHKATCEHTTEISGKASHTFVDDSCSICGYHKGGEIPDNPSGKHTVVFDSNNGSFSNAYSLELTVDTGSLLTVPEEPIRDGYVFVGWAKDSEGTQLWDFSNDKVANNITLYAVWLQEFNITFDANGGKFSDNKNTYELASYYGAKISMVETPERSGYTFIGWYTNSSLADLWDFENNTISSAITLYAGWEADVQEHNITFVLNYSGAENVIRSTENGLVTYIPTRAGYVFNGWWYSDGQTDEGFILSRKFDTAEIVTENGLTLYAEWVEEATVSSQLVAPSVSINQRTFSWVAVSGATGYNIRVYKSGSSEELTNETINGTSWTFPSGYEAGYYNVRIRANGDGINTVNSSYVSKSYAHNILSTISDISFDISTSILTWTVVKDATEYELYINNQLFETLTYTTYDLSDYEAGTYTVKIVSKRNGYQSSTTTKTIEKKRLKTPTDVRTFVNSESKGYTITWDAVAHADTYILMIGDREIRLTDTSYVISSSANYWVEQSLTFTIQAFDSSADYLISIATDEVTLGKIYSLTTEANIENVGEIGVNGNIYIPQEYVVSFNLNGGSGSVASQTITSSEGLKYPSIPTRSNYVFRGWYSDAACTQLYDFTAAVTKNITLYAGWHSITTSGYSTSIIDITSNYRTSSSAYSASNRYATSSSNANYVYFRALTSGSYTFYYKNNKSTSSSYGTYFYIYNVTKGTVVLSNTSTYSTSYSSKSFTADAGDIFYIRAYKYSSNTSYYSNYNFYVTGASLPTVGGKVVGGDYMEATKSDLSSVLVSYDTEVSITATTKDDRYIFAGWYNGETLLTEERTYTFTMPAEDINYTAKWIYYSVTTDKNIDEAGSITSHKDSPVKVGEKVTLTASTNNGYTWLGWYDGNTLLTDELTYTFTMTEQSVAYTAKWMVCPVVLEKSIDEAGSVMGVSGATKAGEETTVTATTNDGYTWLGWYSGDVELTKELSYTFTMPTEAMTLTAKWTYYTVTTNANETNGGSYTTLNAEKTTAGDEVTIVASTNSGYMWMGWYNGETLISLNQSYTFTMSAENIVYTAKWMDCPVTLEKNIEEAGSVGGMGNATVVGEEITVVATTNEGYTFLGWYNGDAKLTEELTYTFNMSTEAVTYTAKWTFYTFTTEVNDSDAGNITSYTGEKITAGSSVTISASTKSGYTFLGWYNGDELITNDSSYTFEMPKENVVYTARWTSYTLTVNKTEGGTVNTRPSSVIVSFDLNGASGESPVSQVVTETNGLTYPDIPMRSNYVFAGWYENADCSGSPFDFSAPICNNKTLYAKWIAYTGAGVISINDHFTVSVVSKGSTSSFKYYAFVPLVSGSITIYTTGSLDTYGYLYNSSKSQLASNDDSGDGSNFSITYSVTAGTLYYIVPCGYSSSGSTTLYLTGSTPIAGGKVSDEALDEFSDPVKVTAGENVTLYAGTNDGYTFLGWYNGDSRVSTNLEYTFVMPTNDIVYIAKWQSCAVSLIKNIEEAGSVHGLEYATRVGEQVTVVATTNEGYTFLGWFNGEIRLTMEESYTFTMMEDAVTYIAKWTSYTVTTNTNDPNAGTYTIKDAEKVTAGESVTLVAMEKSGYTWLGWYNGNEKLTDELSYTFNMPEENIVYTAKWTYYTLTTDINNSFAGTITTKATEKVTAGTSVTLTATVNAGYTWLGWYNGTEKLTDELSYTFDMPSESITYTAKYDAYTLTVDKTDGGTTGMMSAKVNFNLNGSTGTVPATQTVTDKVGLTYPDVPTRSGYLFTGWYTEASCTNLFDFTSSITSDITLYAGWYSYSSNRSIEVGQYTSSSPLAISMSGTSSTEPVYVYFRALRTGSYTFGYKNSSTSSSYATYYYIYDVTAGTVLSANTSVTSTSFATKSLSLTEGHVYYVRLYRYSSNYNPTFSIYLSGTLKPTAGGKTTGNIEVSNYMIAAEESVTLVAKTQEGYTFLGWYSNNQLLSDELTFTFDMPASSVVYTAKWIPCPVTVTVNNTAAGSVSALPSTTIVGQEVTVTATTKAGYTFLGWYNGEQVLSDDLEYTFTMPSVATTITAQWIACPVTIAVNNSAAGSTSTLPSTTIEGKDVTVTATTNDGYTFLGWFEGERRLTTELSYTFAMPSTATTYTAKWMQCPVTLDKNIDEAGSVSGVGGATRIGEQTIIVATTNSGYTFLGWYNGEERLTTSESYTFEMTSASVKYTAKWTYYTLTLNGTEGGTIGNRVSFNLNGGQGNTPETQTITTSNGLVYPDVPTRNGYLFTGWYTESSCVNLFDFSKTVTSDITLYAGWFAFGSDSVIEINQYTSSSPFSFSTSGSTSSAPKYTYFRALSTGTYTFGYKNSSSSSSYATYLYIYDVTANTVIKSNNYYYNTSWSTFNLSLTAGHVYYMKTYARSSSSTFSVYLSGTLQPTAGGLSKAIESNKATKITAGEEVTITATTQKGYIWLGWYNGEDKLTDQLSYTFEMPAANVIYTAKRTYHALNIDKTEGGNVEKYYEAIITFDLQGGNGSIASQTITHECGLKYPNTIPTKSGYIFTGWYSDENCTALYDFTQKLDRDITLYAGWYKLSGNVIEINEYDASNPYSFSTQGSYYISQNKTIEDPILTYFRVLSTGSYSISYKNSSTTTSARMLIYDATTNRTVKASEAVKSTSFVTETYSFEAGHIYYVSVLGSSTATHTTFSMYIQGTLLPADGGVCDSIEADSNKLLPGQRVTLIASTDRNYTFLGWYDGDRCLTDELVYTFVMTEANITYTARWEGYTVTVTPTEGGDAERVFKHTVEFDENYTSGSKTQQIVFANSGLKYTIPTRAGYIFTGWYTESSCKNLYDFTATLYEDITLYAGWTQYTTGACVEVNDYSESSPFVMTTNGTSSSNYGYIRFRALVSGEYTFGYKLDSSYSTYLYIYDETAKVAIKTNSSFSSTTWNTLTLNLTAGHVYYARIYRSSTSYYTNFSMYLSGTKLPADGGKSDADNKVASGDTVTIQATTKPGYTWLGWYLDGEFVSDDFAYTFVMPNRSVVYEARWTCFTVITNTNAEGGGTYTQLDGQKIAYGDSVTLTATLNDGYTWCGWYEGDELLSNEMTYTFTMGAEERVITAKYGFEEVILHYVVDGQVIHSEKMTFESSLESLYNYNADGKNFSGWYANNACNSAMDKVVDTTKLKANAENQVYVYGATYVGTANLTFAKMGEEYSITGYAGSETAIVLPNQYNGLPVTRIADRAFYANDSLYRITVSNSITEIGTSAFHLCYRLAEIDNLSELEITVGSMSNGYIAYYATKVYKTEENNGERIITDNDGYVFYYDGTTYYLIDYTGSSTELSLPEKVKDSSYEIAAYAFYNRSSITSVELSSGVTKIGEYAFSNCAALTTVIFGANVSSIDETAFYMCAELRTISLDESNTYFTCVENNLIEKATKTLILGCSDNIPNDGSVTVIGMYAFAWRTNIENVTISSYITEVKEYAFYGCSGLNSLTIQSGIAKIGEYAFFGATFSTISVPTSVNSIGYAAFGGNGNITTMTLPFVGGSASASAASESTLFGYIFGRDSYANSTRATQYYEASHSVVYYIPTSLTSITVTGGNILYGAFYGCSRLTNVNISVSQIGDRAFYNCYGITTLSISTTRSIGAYAFANCYKLTSVSIPSTVTSIGSAALSGCYGLTELTIPFVGSSSSASAASTETLFGYIFGETEYSNSTAVQQRYAYSSYATYYLPKNLTSVQVLRGSLLYGAFYGCTMLQSVNLSSVTSIGDYAFYNCNSIAEITIPYSTTSIGSYAFSGCVALTKAIMGSGVNTIGNYAFQGCTALNDVTLGSNVSSIGSYAFSGCRALEQITIPSKVTSISASMFSGCTSLSHVTMQGNVTSIGASAFYNCGALETIGIPSTVQQIGESAFANSGLTSLELPASLTSSGLGNKIISGCDNLRTLTISGSSVYTSVNNCIVRSKTVVLGCAGSTIPTSSSTVTAIGNYAFYGCTGKTSLTIPTNITSIGNYAFNGAGLTKITIPSSVTSVGEYAFAGCSLTSVAFGGSTTTIGKSAFSGCSSLASVTLPTNLTTVSDSLFSSCSKLSSVSIPSTVTSIGSNAFYACRSLTTIVVPTNVTSIGAGAFSACTGLTSISLPFIGGSSSATTASASTLFGYIFGTYNFGSGVKATTQNYSTSGSATYYIPTSLKTVTLTTDCKLLYGAFQNCSNITTINLYSSSTITSIPAYAFYNTGITSIKIPTGVTSIANTSFQNCSELTSISIPNGVTSLGEGTLSGCSSLTSVTLPFVGASATQNSRSCGYPFGYIFGTSSFSGAQATAQTYYSVQYTQTKATTTYYIPKSLKSVTILNYTSGYWGSSDNGNDKYIVYGAFYGCSNLTSITLPSGTNDIFQYAFYECNALTSISIPSGVTYIGDYAFYNCNNLSSVTFSSTKTLERIGMYAFKKCSKLTSITLPTSLTILETDCFSETGLTSVTIPSSVETSYSGTWFTNCKSLTTVKFSGSKITYIGGYSGCSSLTSITIPTSVTSIASKAFYGCSSLTSITIPAAVTSIGSEAFSGCTRLKTVTFTSNSSSSASKLTSIGTRAFYGCSALTSIIIPVNVTSIDSYAFYGCSSLTSATFRTTSGWRAGSYSVTLTNTATNATYLSSDYATSSWRRS